jgi:hypothetical protein
VELYGEQEPALVIKKLFATLAQPVAQAAATSKIVKGLAGVGFVGALGAVASYVNDARLFGSKGPLPQAPSGGVFVDSGNPLKGAQSPWVCSACTMSNEATTGCCVVCGAVPLTDHTRRGSVGGGGAAGASCLIRQFIDAFDLEGLGLPDISDTQLAQIIRAGDAGTEAYFGAQNWSFDLHKSERRNYINSLVGGHAFSREWGQIQRYLSEGRVVSDEMLTRFDAFSGGNYPFRSNSITSGTLLYSSLADTLLFHEIVPYLHLGNDQTVKYLLANPMAQSLNELYHKPQSVFTTEGSEWTFGSRPCEMPPLPSLIITACSLNEFGRSYDFRDVELRNGTRVLYVPSPEDGSNAYESVFVKHKKVIFEAIDQTLLQNKHVLIHCSNGAHRSATIMFAYLKEHCPEISCWKIMTYLRMIRPNVKDPREVLIRRQSSNMLNTAIRDFCGITPAWRPSAEDWYDLN